MSGPNNFTSVLRILWTGVDGLRKVLHLLILLFIFAIVIGAMSASVPVVPGKAALIIRPSGNIVEQLEGNPYDRAIEEAIGEADAQTLVQDIVDGLAYARDDDRIKAVVLELGGMGGTGFSKLERISEAIEDFSESGKPVIANANFYGQGAYFLASRADEVYMHPDGMMFLRGFGAYRNYYKNAIDKLKVDWNVFRVGTHKSAVEPYTRNDMSDAARSSLGSLLDQLWDFYQGGIVEARNLESGALDEILADLVASVKSADGSFAQLALQQSLVDGLLTHEELKDRIIEHVGEDADDEKSYPSTELSEYVAEMRLQEGLDDYDENIGIIVAAGEILNGSQSPGRIGGESTSALLRRAAEDESVKAVVLRVDSPGGSIFASRQIRYEVEALRAMGKPVVASMGSYAASGGYWISMSTDKIFARDTTITGSIGVYGMLPTFQRTMDTLGVTTDGIGTSPWAGALRPDRGMSDDAKELFQVMIEYDYDDFISKVSEFRGIDKGEVDRIAQGQVWTGSEALANGLIDEIGGLNEAIKAAAELADLDQDDYGVLRFHKELSSSEQLVVEFLSRSRKIGIDWFVSARRSSPINNIAEIVEDVLSPLTRFDDPRGSYSHCFCVFE